MRLRRLLGLCASLAVLFALADCGGFGTSSGSLDPLDGSAAADARLADGGLLPDLGTPCALCDDFERDPSKLLGPWTKMDEQNGTLKLNPAPDGVGQVLLVENVPDGGASKVALYADLRAPATSVDVELRMYARAVTAGEWARLFYVELIGTPPRRISFEVRDGQIDMQERIDGKAQGGISVGPVKGRNWHTLKLRVFLQGGVWAAKGSIDDAAGPQTVLSPGPVTGAQIAVGDHSTSVSRATIFYDDVRVYLDTPAKE